MTDENHASPRRGKLQPLSYMPVNPAKVMLAEGMSEAATNPALFGAVWTIALHTWIHGPMDLARAQRRLTTEVISELADMGAITVADGEITVPWVEECRTEADALRVSYSQRGKEAAERRWRADASGIPQASLKHTSAMPEHARRGEERREEKRKGEKRRGEHTDQPDNQITADAVGGPERKPKGTPLTRAWDDIWLEARGVAWGWQPKDAVSLARAAKLVDGDESEVIRRMRTMLASPDAWTQQNASPALLLSQWNKWAVTIVPLSQQDRSKLNRAKQLEQLEKLTQEGGGK